MPMFASSSRKPIIYSTLGIGDGLPQNQLAPQKRGMFGGGRAWAGILGDALAALGGQQGVYAPAMLARRQEEREDERWNQRLQAQMAAKQVPSPSTAAKMAVEAGLTPGTPAFQKFVTRYAFSPRLVAVGNAQGGTDQIEYDPSGMTDAPSGGLPAGYDPSQWEVVE